MQCECCGMAEECTPTFIGRVREHFQGKYVCGLCTEAVKERQQRCDPDVMITVRAAVEAHAALCQRFNSTVRLNPKLSLASSMRDIARKSSQNRGRGACNTGAGRGTGMVVNKPPACCNGGGRAGAGAAGCALPYV